MVNVPVPLIVLPKTSSPFDFSLGILSPLIEDSSMAVIPDKIIPSVGTWSPFNTWSRSPTFKILTATISVFPSGMIRLAVVGVISSSFVISRLLLPSAYSSRKWAPEKMRISSAPSPKLPRKDAPSVASPIRTWELGVNRFCILVFSIVSPIPSRTTT